MINLLAIFAGLLGVAVVAFYFNRAGNAREDRFSGRVETDLPQIYVAHFAATGISQERFAALWSELADILEVPAGKLLPSDRFKVELSPPKGFEFNDPIKDVMYTIQKNCQRANVNPDHIESIHDYIMMLGLARPTDRS